MTTDRADRAAPDRDPRHRSVRPIVTGWVVALLAPLRVRLPGGPAVAMVTLVAAVSGRRRREPLYRVDQAVTMRTRTALSEAAQTSQAQGTTPSRAGVGR